MGAALHRALAKGPGADGGRQCRAADRRSAARRGYHSLNAKGNFRFERTIVDWRSGFVLDLRRKE